MIKNYFLTAIRSLIKHKGFSILNILGLAISLAMAFLIGFWIIDESSIGKIHEDADRIYRIERKGEFQGNMYHVPITSPPYGETMVEDYPQVVDATMIDLRINNVKAANEDAYSRTEILLADSNFFDFFSFKLLQGNPATVLNAPGKVVLTKTKAEKMFGQWEKAMNQEVLIDYSGEEHSCMVSGVMEDLPHDARMHFDLVVQMYTLVSPIQSQNVRWVSNSYFSYIKLAEGANIEDIQSQMKGFVDKYLYEPYTQVLGQKIIPSEYMNIHLRNINDIYLKGGLDWEDFATGDRQQVFLFALIAIMIIIIAAFNYTNLSVALATKRSREIGIRKSAGATRGEIRKQFYGEALLITMISLLLSILFVELLLPWFNDITGKEFSIAMLVDFRFVLLVIMVVAVTSLGAGFYPALYLSSFDPVKVLKPGMYRAKSKSVLQNSLIIFQFVISSLLIIVAGHMILQFQYIENKELGFRDQDVMIIDAENTRVQENISTIGAMLRQLPFTEEISFCSQAPSSGYYSDMVFENEMTERPIQSFLIYSDSNYIDLFELELLAGRNFSRAAFSDSTRNEYIINETTMRRLGIQSPDEAVGVDFRYPFDSVSDYSKIVGVVKDFHFRPLYYDIEGLTITHSNGGFQNITVAYTGDDRQEIIGQVQDLWHTQFSGAAFNYYMLEDRIGRLYAGELRTFRTLMIFAVFAILIAALGLIGLSAFITRQRKKEIGIRKVLGAETSSILRLFVVRFLWLVLAANLIAAPLAWYFVDSWFAEFASHINIKWWMFLVTLFITGLIAMVATIGQVLQTAYLNPVDAVKYE